MLENIIADSAVMQTVLRMAERVAPTDATILLTGESGTGKTALANYIHAQSPRSNRDLVRIDCASLPKELLEAELFGHDKGAFTGAGEARAGRLEAADNSTLLLDEIALLSIEAQAKLLRVLEQREFERIGGRKIIKIATRVIATTNVDLENAIAAKTFREDLFFRLNVVRIAMPPLRERRADIAGLCRYFAELYAAKHDCKKAVLTPEAIDVLENYDFPGNIRELSNLLERLILFADSEKITAADLPPNVRNSSDCWQTLAEIETAHIRRTLAAVNGNKSKAAKLLGISRKNLYEKLARFPQIAADV